MTQPYGYLHVVQAIHGDAFVLEYNEGQRSGFMLIDGGPGQSYRRTINNVRTTAETTANLFRLLMDLSNRNGHHRLQYIDTVVVTHDDEDHKNGIADLFRYLVRDALAPTVDWQAGLDMMTAATPEQPIRSIWYNSQSNLMRQIISDSAPSPRILRDLGWVDPATGLPKVGWFDALLDTYNATFPRQIRFSQEFTTPRDVTLAPNVNLVFAGCRGRNRNAVQRGQFSFKFIGPIYKGELDEPRLVSELVETSAREADRLPNQDASQNWRGGSHITAATTSSTLDSSRKNRSSIAFVAKDTQTTQAGVQLVMLGDAVVAGKVDPGDYTIMKIAHHGSGHNNYLSARLNPMNDAKIKISDGVLKNAVRFFYSARAKKYVISASPSEGSPNPHITTILGIYIALVEACVPARGRQAAPTLPVDVYMTNKFPRNTLQGFGYFLFNPDDMQYTGLSGEIEHALPPGENTRDIISRLDFNNFDTYMRLWLLRPGAQYGSIPIYDRDPPTTTWMRVTKDDLLRDARSSLRPRKIVEKDDNTTPPPTKRRRQNPGTSSN